MFEAAEIVGRLEHMGITHVVWLPDSALGPWESALEAADGLQLIRVCREGEAWPLAAGLMLGGATPLVMMQTTGLFESGDALRNVVFDLRLPVFAIIGARSWLVEGSQDSARRFTLPILSSWGIAHVLIERPDQKGLLESHWRQCRDSGRPGLVLLAEGRM